MDARVMGLAICLWACALAGCAPDLVVRDVRIKQWDDAAKVVEAQISNIGYVEAREVSISFVGDEEPVSLHFRPAIVRKVARIGKDETIALVVDFQPQARRENSFLANVQSVTVKASLWSLFGEVREDNNEITVSVGGTRGRGDWGPSLPLTSRRS